MKGRLLTIEDLKVLPWGTKITWGACEKEYSFAGVTEWDWAYKSKIDFCTLRSIDKYPVYIWEEEEEMKLYGCKSGHNKYYDVRYGKKSEMIAFWDEVIEIKGLK